ncbi:MAG TPA: UDP-N-acetylmuramoyl-L-alanine--D-glutamate ligase, partial [Nitrospirae bacterium]|nr:UDP-N-acetylmuramoyl-L-alanine--D-glutamate ligase [Nitrospirota bacterium]
MKLSIVNRQSSNNKRVLVVGLGRSGLAAARLLHFLKAEVTVTDTGDKNVLSQTLKNLPGDVRVETGGHSPVLLEDTDMVVVSPGVSLKQPFFDLAMELGIEVIGEMELAFRLLRPYGISWVSITGTNGKSTTTTLIDLMLTREGFRVITGGNLGTAITEEVLRCLKDGTAGDVDYVVVEVSSFQLESIRSFAPSLASILNITPDHLDRYKDMEGYIKAKTEIFKNQTRDDCLILNLDDPLVRELGAHASPEVFYFSRQENPLTGMGGVTPPIPRGAYMRDGWLCINADGKEDRIIRVQDVRIKGVHNIENALAASLNAFLCGVDMAAIRDVLSEFRGLEHRMEFVEEIKGVRFYNDSKGTNPGSVIKSLEGFQDGVILILGGRDKGSDFTPLREYMKGRVKGLVVIGEARDKILRQLDGVTDTLEAEDMTDAVRKAYSMAGAGDVVLLSPGCASFDMFEDFEHRGEV